MILSTMAEGNAVRSISRVVGVSINIVTKLLIEAGKACAKYHNNTERNVKTTREEYGEIWSFVYVKDKKVKTATDGAGDVWT